MKKLIAILSLIALFLTYTQVKLIMFWKFWEGVPRFTVWAEEQEMVSEYFKILLSAYIIGIPFIFMNWFDAVIVIISLSIAVVLLNIIRWAIWKRKRNKYVKK